jgi:hypothetical protein
MQRLEQDENWQKLEPEQRNQLLSEQKLTLADQPEFNLASTETILATLDKQPLSSLADRIVALPARFDNVAVDAAELLEPQAQFIQVPRRTLRSMDDMENWLIEVRNQLEHALNLGPIVIK